MLDLEKLTDSQRQKLSADARKLAASERITVAAAAERLRRDPQYTPATEPPTGGGKLKTKSADKRTTESSDD